jgi:KaiC/GvpD/RAD55 family RecA-like ATPase
MASDTKMIRTENAGIDALFTEGIPELSQLLLLGAPGTGKTLLSFEILYRAAKSGVPSAFVALDDDPKMVIRNAKLAFPEMKDIDRLVENGTLVVDGDGASSKLATTTDPDTYSFGSLVSDIEDIIKSNKARMVAIDSISFVRFVLGNTIPYRRAILSMISNFKRLGATGIFTIEMHSTSRDELMFGQESFLFDGLLNLYQGGEAHGRALAMEVMKMRGAKHSRALAPYEITPSGFKLSNV